MSTYLVRFLLAAVAGLPFCGCEVGDESAFGTPQTSALLAPFAGKWECDEQRSVAAAKAAGLTEQDLAGYQVVKKLYGGKIHPDLEIAGNTIRYQGFAASEYWLFGLHQHDDYVCGKAWHHEDRFDPGDMSKCYVRVKLQDGLLFLDIKRKDGLPDDDDPDLVADPAVESGSAKQCDAGKPHDSDWDANWETLVFKRKG